LIRLLKREETSQVMGLVMWLALLAKDEHGVSYFSRFQNFTLPASCR
jgi:hypothetical protein